MILIKCSALNVPYQEVASYDSIHDSCDTAKTAKIYLFIANMILLVVKYVYNNCQRAPK